MNTQNIETTEPRSKRGLFCTRTNIVYIILIILIISLRCVFEPINIVGRSMEPTYMDGDICIVYKLYDDYQYGDIITIRTESRGKIIKRIIGLPGDVIEIKDSTVYRNGEALDEPYTHEGQYRGFLTDEPVTVKPGHIIVLGDNRPESADSRSPDIGQVPFENIIGKCEIRLFNMHTILNRDN